MKRFRQLFGLGLLIGVVILCLYGIGDLEKAEERRIQSKNLEQMFQKNSDAYAWIRVEGTKINYPVLQHPTDDAYYLTHDAEGNETQYGAIFTEKVNQPSFEDPVTIIYGHAMRDDSMFGSLDYLAEPSTFESIQTVTITKDGKDFLYQIVAAYSFTDDHLYHTFGLGDTKQVESYVSLLEAKANEYGGFYRSFDFDVTRDKLLILSTCDVAGNERRFVVHAVRKGGS
ncbi:class B sortase [Streptococcus suis]|uniref:class B sortase n=2 Tax=Streptococcus suis TaxID=1307 RepID=UPI003BA2CCD4